VSSLSLLVLRYRTLEAEEENVWLRESLKDDFGFPAHAYATKEVDGALDAPVDNVTKQVTNVTTQVTIQARCLDGSASSNYLKNVKN
jgi:hypothetical protein